MSLTNTPTLDYATPTHPAPKIIRFENAMGMSAIAGGIGLLILLGFAVTDSALFILLGFLWLLVGGAITLAAVANGAYAWSAHQARYLRPHTRRRAFLAAWMPLGVIAVAIFCVLVGGWLISLKLQVDD